MYEVLAHTADVGVAAEAPDLAELFSEAARGMAAVILDADPPGPSGVEPVDVGGEDAGACLVAFLEECLYRFEVHGMLVCGARLEVGEHASGFHATGDLLTCSGLQPDGPQIKAVTYHQLSVRRVDDVWRAEVFFDV